MWTYVRDDRPASDLSPPAVWFAYSPDHKGEHPKQHLRNFSGILQADAYAGFHHLYEDGRIQEAACWAHLRRKFYDIHLAHESPIAAEALEGIAALYAVENDIRGNAACLCWHPCVPGWRKRCLLCHGNPIPQSPSAMDSRAGLHCCVIATTDRSKWTTTPQNAHCGP